MPHNERTPMVVADGDISGAPLSDTMTAVAVKNTPEELDNESKREDIFLVTFSEADSTHPYRLSRVRKWTITLLLCTATINMGYTSAVYSPAFSQVATSLSTSRIAATLGLSLFIAGLGAGGPIFSPLSEYYGRKPMYLISLSLFLVWIVPCARAERIEVLLIARFLNGISGSVFTSVAGGSVGDMFEKKELAGGMMIFTAAPFWGAGLGPIIGGLICQFTSWRWIFYHLLIWAFVQFIAIVAIVPETYHPVLRRNKARQIRKETGDDRHNAPIELLERSIFQTVFRSMYRPFMLLTLEPMCLILCLYTAIVLGIQYLFFGAFPLVFRGTYSFEIWQVALTFLGMLMGMTAAVFTGTGWNTIYLRLIKSHSETKNNYQGPEPEYRLPPAMVGAPFITIGLFWFAWTINPSIHWVVPIIGSSLYGFGSILVYSGVFTFLVDSYPLYAASALGANSFTRSMFAAGFPLFGVQMYNTLGYKWASSLLAFLSLAMLPFPFLFYRYGKRIRAKSRLTGPR